MTGGRASTSLKKDWQTPPKIIASVDAVFGGTIDLDPCSNSTSLVNAREKFILPEYDGLAEGWGSGKIFVNPPYGRDPARGTSILDWFKKIREAVDAGAEVIALVPVATNTRHWKDHVFPLANALCFLADSRLKFYSEGVLDPKGAPMACAVIYYGESAGAFKDEFSSHGRVIFVR